MSKSTCALWLFALSALAPVSVEAATTVGFAASSSSAAEASGLGQVVVVNTTGGPTNSAFTVTVSVTGGTTTAADFNLTGTLTIPAGTVNGATLTLAGAFAVTDDSLLEDDENVRLALSAPTGIGSLGAQTTHNHTIIDDESATLTGATSGFSESVGTTNVGFTLVITDTTAATGAMAVPGAFDAYTVQLGGNTAATSGVDYGAIANGALTIAIPVGATSGQTISVPISIINDALVEEAEFFDVVLDHGVNVNTWVAGSIQNTVRISASDSATVTWTATGSNASETATPHPALAVLTINSDPPGGALENAVTVAINASNGTATAADYSLATTAITFPAGATGGAIQTVDSTIVADGLGEGDETFSLGFGAITSSGTNTTASGTHTVTITEATVVQFGALTSSAAEAAGLGSVVVVHTGNGSPTAAAFNVTVAVTGGTATTADYTLTGTLTIPAGTVSGAALPLTGVFAISDDSMLEDDETVRLTLSAPTGGVRLGSRSTHTHTIIDDESATLTGTTSGFSESVGTANVGFTLVITDTTAATGAMAVPGAFDAYTVQLLNSTAATSGVDYGAIANGALTIAIPVGATSGQTIPVPISIVNDALVEEAEFFDVVLDHGVNVNTGVAGSIQNTVRISASDSATVTWTATGSIAPETAKPHPVTAVLTINSDPPGGALENAVTVAINASNGTATAADYSLSTPSITFPAGAAGGTARTVNSAIVADGLGEGDQTFSLGFGAVTSTGTNTTATGTHTVTITENNRLQFGQQPSNALTGVALAPTPTVRILDAAGNLTNSAALVTVALAANPGGSTLGGSTTVAAVGGIAAFPGLTLNNPGTGYTLIATSAGLTSAASTAFTISCPPTIVTSSNDSGAGSLRQIIADACPNSTISFAAAVSTVNLSSAQLSLGKNLTIAGGTSGVTVTRLAGSPNFRIMQIAAGSTVTLERLTISNGSVAGFGAGVLNAGTLTVRESVIRANVSSGAFGGGGIANDGGTLIVDNSTVSGNSAASLGGGVVQHNGGSMTFTRSTLSGNTAAQGGAILSRSQGGAASLTVGNCTISGNSATGSGSAIQVLAEAGGSSTLALRNSTVAAQGGGTETIFTRVVAGSASSTLGHNIYADNIGLNVGSAGGGVNTSVGNNVSDDASGGGGPGDMLNTNPLLAALGDYGGSTQTHALLPGSPALNAGNNSGAPATDQRGISRPQQGTVDIGAYESRGFTLAVASGDNQSAGPGLGFASPLVVAVTPTAAGEPVNGGSVVFTPPATGASATLVPASATISSALASTAATANTTVGSYSVSATARAASAPVTFALNNAGATLRVDDVDITEGDAGSNLAVFTVTRSNALTAGSVSYSVSAGTAQAGSDYVPTSGTLSFAVGGALTQTISVPVFGDLRVEAAEEATVNLGAVSNTTGVTTVADGSAQLRIADKDSAVVQFTPASVSQSEG